MDADNDSENLGLKRKIEEALSSHKSLIIEASPSLPHKFEIIMQILNNLTGPNSKLVICVSHLNTISTLAKLLQQAAPLIKAVILSSKQALCCNSSINFASAEDIELKCKDLSENQSCPYSSSGEVDLPSIVTLTELKEKCEKSGICPFYLTKKLLHESKAILCTQAYFFRKGFDEISDFRKDSVLLFEDSVDLDTCTTDYMSVNLNLKVLSSALRGIEEISEKFNQILSSEPSLLAEKSEDSIKNHQNLVDDFANGNKKPTISIADYEKFCQDIKSGTASKYINNGFFIRNVIGCDALQTEPIPGNIRRPLHFFKMLKMVIVFLRQYLRGKEPSIISGYGFLYKLLIKALVEADSLKFSSYLLSINVNFVKAGLTENVMALSTVCDFCSFAAQFPLNYCLVFEPYPEHPSLLHPILQLSCQNPSDFLSNVLSSFSSSFLFTTSCMPPEIFLKILGINCEIMNPSWPNKICPMILTKGSDQLFLSTKTDEKTDDGVMRNYGEIILELSDIIPDGIVVFFPEWSVLENYVMKWNESGLLYRLLEQKIVLIESPGVEHRILNNFSKACECGRGAMLLALSRGKLANDLHAYGSNIRCSIAFGVPQMDIMSRALKARLLFLKEKMGIDESDYLNFDAMRQAIICLSQSLRSGAGYSIMILADKRFESNTKKERIPKWISGMIKANQSVSTDVAKNVSANFLKAV